MRFFDNIKSFVTEKFNRTNFSKPNKWTEEFRRYGLDPEGYLKEVGRETVSEVVHGTDTQTYQQEKENKNNKSKEEMDER